MMKKIINRLEIINKLISLGEAEEINYHLEKLNQLQYDNSINHIILMLEAQDYINVVSTIDTFLKNNQALITFEAVEKSAQKLKLSSLETKYNVLQNNLQEVNDIIKNYDSLYIKIVREVELIYMNLLDDIRYLEYIKKNKNNLKEKPLSQHEYHKKAIKEASTGEEIQINTKELKTLYKEASKLIHPDKVSENLKSIAHQIMSMINDAYQNKNVQFLNSILIKLKSGSFEFNDLFVILNNSNDTVKSQILYYEHKISLLELQLDNLKNTKSYQTAVQYASLEDFFSQRVAWLKEQTINLQNQKEELFNAIHKKKRGRPKKIIEP